MTVSGSTSRTASSKRRERPPNPPRSHRSNRRRPGRLTRRRATMSCCRRSRFSATKAARGATTAKTRSSRKWTTNTELRTTEPYSRVRATGGGASGRISVAQVGIFLGEIGSLAPPVRNYCAPQRDPLLRARQPGRAGQRLHLGGLQLPRRRRATRAAGDLPGRPPQQPGRRASPDAMNDCLVRAP